VDFVEVNLLGQFGDFRLNRVGARLFKRTVERGRLIVKNLANDRKEQVQFERFLWNEKVTIEKMLEESRADVSKRVSSSKAKHVCLIQDTTEFDFTHRKDEVRGLGNVTLTSSVGSFSHPVIAVDPRDGFVLGITGCKFWSRDPKRVHARKNPDYNKIPETEKESYRWIEVIKESKSCLSEAEEITVITDREGDMYTLFTELKDEKTNILSRSKGLRTARMSGDKDRGIYLNKLMEQVDFSSTRIVELPKQSKINHRKKISAAKNRGTTLNGRQSREVTLAIKHAKVEIFRPKNLSSDAYPETFEAHCIFVQEVDPPEECRPVEWVLITTRNIDSDEDAWSEVDLYRKRWIIEVIFRTSKKGGYNAESIEAARSDAIIKLCFLGLLASVKVLQLTQCRDGKIERPITTVFSEIEIMILKKLNKKMEGRTESQKNPHKGGTLAWAYWVIARRGGWMGTKSEGPAGAIVIKRGLDRLQQAVEALELLQEDVCIS